MNIGIVTTWFERGAAYVSKLFEDKLAEKHNVYIYARGGEEYAIGNSNWDKENVTWGKKIVSPFSSTVIDKSDFINWINNNNIELIIFNEQHWFQPLIWCKELNVKTVAYIDYYTEQTIPLFDIYDALICNTKKHKLAFNKHKNAYYIPWGTDIELFKPNIDGLVNNEYVTFFHSCGWDTHRKGTDLLLKAFNKVNTDCKLILHTQNEIKDDELVKIIEELKNKNKLELIIKTVPSPGLFYLGDVYLYPSRLEGIGLTIAESIASGLATVLPDNAPMNEFIEDNITGNLIKIDRLYARADGYYWPKCEVSVEDLTSIIEQLSIDKLKVISMKKNARTFATKKLDSSVNFNQLFNLVDECRLEKTQKKLIDEINNFDNRGMKRFNKFYLNFYPIFNSIRNLSKK